METLAETLVKILAKSEYPVINITHQHTNTDIISCTIIFNFVTQVNQRTYLVDLGILNRKGITANDSIDQIINHIVTTRIFLIKEIYYICSVKEIKRESGSLIITIKYDIVNEYKSYLDCIHLELLSKIFINLDLSDLTQVLKLLENSDDIWKMLLLMRFPEILKICDKIDIIQHDYKSLYNELIYIENEYDLIFEDSINKFETKVILILEKWLQDETYRTVELSGKIWRMYLYVKYKYLYDVVVTDKVLSRMIESLCGHLESHECTVTDYDGIDRNFLEVLYSCIYKGIIPSWESLYLDAEMFNSLVYSFSEEEYPYLLHIMLLLVDVSKMTDKHGDLIKKVCSKISDIVTTENVSKQFCESYLDKIRKENPALYDNLKCK